MTVVSSELSIYGEITVQLIRNGTVIAEETDHNVTCNAGIAAVNATASGAGNTFFTYIGIGTGSTAPAATDTALTAELYRVSAVWSAGTTTSTNDTAVLTCGFTFVASYTIAEAGLFSTPTSNTGIILGHVLIGPLSAVPGDVLSITWKEVY